MTDRYKLLAFVLSAALAGLADPTKASVLGFATLTDVHWSMSGLVVLMTLVGGLGTLTGPIVAVLIITLENKLGEIGALLGRLTGVTWFNVLGESATMVIGFIFIVCVLAFRRGLVGELGAMTGAWKAGRVRRRQARSGRAAPETQAAGSRL